MAYIHIARYIRMQYVLQETVKIKLHMTYLSYQEFHRFLPSFMNVMIMAYIHIARYICTYAVCFIGNCRIQITQFLVPSTFCIFLFFCGKNILCQGPRLYGCSWCFSTHDFPSCGCQQNQLLWILAWLSHKVKVFWLGSLFG